MKAFLDWCFRSRVTGRITIAQFPNNALWLFLAASLAAWKLQPGASLTVAKVIAFGSGVYWAVEELLRGVNPWRRVLGLTVLLFLLVDAARFGLEASARYRTGSHSLPEGTRWVSHVAHSEASLLVRRPHSG